MHKTVYSTGRKNEKVEDYSSPKTPLESTSEAFS